MTCRAGVWGQERRRCVAAADAGLERASSRNAPVCSPLPGHTHSEGSRDSGVLSNSPPHSLAFLPAEGAQSEETQV